ncbi:MAG: FixH family protein [Gammaproteobacteria bacterium]
MKSNTEPVTRWQQEPLAWLVFAIPLGTIAACALLYAIASSNSDSLVVDDYYKRGLQINKVLDREARAAERGLAIGIDTLRDGILEFSLSAGAADYQPESLAVRLSHATRSQVDQTLTARHAGDGRYVAAPGALAPGPWYVDVSSDDWRLVTRHHVNN